MYVYIWAGKPSIKIFSVGYCYPSIEIQVNTASVELRNSPQFLLPKKVNKKLIIKSESLNPEK